MDDPLDAAFDLFHRYRPEYGGGMSSHGTMVVEALDHADRPDDIARWAAAYATHLEPAAAPGPVRSTHRVLGSGDADDWTAAFLEELEHREWTDVVASWLPVLAPGSVGAAGHGVLRAAHAIRALERSAREVRVVELANGLGYWAATAHLLPGVAPTGRSSLRDALVGVAPTTTDAFFISERVAHIDPLSFGRAVAAAALPSDPDEALTEVVDLALRALATNPGGAIAFVHSVTVPACLRTLLPYADAAGRRAVAVQGWWVLAALWSAYGRRPPLRAAGDAPSWDALMDAAVASGDEHDIKLTVAARDQGGRVDDALARAAVATVVATSV